MTRHLTHTHTVYVLTRTHGPLPQTPAHKLPTCPKKHTHTHLNIHTVRLCDIFVIIFHLCFHLNLHSYQSLYCFRFIVLGKVICHDLCGHRNCFSSVDGQSRQCVLQRQRSYSWGHLYFCSHSFSLQKQQILYTLEGNWRAVHTVKIEHCMV